MVTGEDPFAVVPLVPPTDAERRVAAGAVLVDVRSAPRRAADGAIPGAIIADRTNLAEEFGLDSPDRHAPITSHETPIVVVCGSVDGSRPVAEALIEQGFTDVVHVEGGFAAWAAAGLPVTPPTATPSISAPRA
ncbi:rhodanese-like domain-containing protein [Dactylosporangium sp. CA-233914]|uniref:rhodanese-like domain-containing protein n=1 Tax=Dactylosporangium sp. CA-233914 TaxID=3239934 RepID=UPI003D8B52F7